MKGYRIVLADGTSYTAEAYKVYVDGPFIVLLGKESIIAVLPSTTTVIAKEVTRG